MPVAKRSGSAHQGSRLESRATLGFDGADRGKMRRPIARNHPRDRAQIIADDGRDDPAAVAPVAEVPKPFQVAGCVIKRLAVKCRLESEVGHPPETGAVQGIDIPKALLQRAK